MSLILEGIDLPKGDTAKVIICIQPNGEVRDVHGILLDAKAIQIGSIFEEQRELTDEEMQAYKDMLRKKEIKINEWYGR